MLDIENYWLFILSGIILNITPGSDTIYILGRSVTQGKKAGLISAIGISSGILVHTILAAFGLSVILTKSIIAFNLIKYIGATYLIYLGIKTFFMRSNISLTTSTSISSMRKVYFQGLLTNVLNPKVALFFLSFLPQFVNAENDYGPFPFIILGITFVITATIWCLFLVLFFSKFTNKLRENSRITTFLNKLVGIIFVSLGLNLIRHTHVILN